MKSANQSEILVARMKSAKRPEILVISLSLPVFTVRFQVVIKPGNITV